MKRPDGHYTEDYKPPNFDVNRIFMTPSAKYCGLGEVYTKPCRWAPIRVCGVLHPHV